VRTYRAANLTTLWFLITINVLVFIFTSVRPDMRSFLGLLPYPYFSIQPWAIITHMFIHANFWHILCNMISLYFLGSFLLRLIGEGKFLIVYFLGGLIGGLFYVFVSPPPFPIPAVGASGAIFALGGALAMMAPKLPVFMFFIPIPVPLWIAIIVFLLISFVPGIAWQAHLGGLLLGLGAGYYYKKKRRVYF